jgi:hypothetical protein
MTLTVDNITQALEDERHLGFGYYESRSVEMPKRKLERLDRAVIRQANALGLDQERFFHWTNSKYGRWLVDDVYGCDRNIAEAVALALNAEAVEVACDV